MIVPYNHVLILAGLLFLIGLFCALTRRNLIMVLVGLEIMINAASVAFVGDGLHHRQMEGQVIALFILAVAAAEVAMGLTLIVCVYRQTATIDPACIESDTCRLEEG